MKNVWNQVPGHFKADTWLVALLSAIVAWAITSSLDVVMGVELVVFGAFVRSHATHLSRHHQENGEIPPTQIEQKMLRYPRTCRWVGLFMVIVGVAVFAFFASQPSYRQGWENGLQFCFHETFDGP